MYDATVVCNHCSGRYIQKIEFGHCDISKCPKCHGSNGVDSYKYLKPMILEAYKAFDICHGNGVISSACLTDIRTNLEIMATQKYVALEANRPGVVKRATLIIEIAQLLLQNQINEEQFCYFVGRLPSDNASGYRLEGTTLIFGQNTPSGVHFTRISPDGSEADGGYACSMKLMPLDDLLPASSTGRPSSGCLLAVLLGGAGIPLCIIGIAAFLITSLTE